MWRRALALSSLLACTVACAGGERSKIGVPEPAEDAGEASPPDASDAGGAGGEGGAPSAAKESPAEPKPDPAVIKLALDKTGQSTAIENAPYGLRFEVVEQGPELPWAIAVVNRGSEPMRVAYDPRLLRLEVEPAPPAEEPVVKGKRKPKPKAKPKKVDCALPDSIRPSKPDKKLALQLAPGEGVVETFDPRLYCLPSDGKSPLQPGAVVTAHLGWRVKKKTVWRKGKRTEEPLPQKAPFVAMPVNIAEAPKPEAPPEAAKGAKSAKGAKAEAPAEVGVKELVATPLTLGADYAAKLPPEDAKLPPLEVRFTRGADASSEETATVTVQIRNRSDESLRVFFRRELVSFEVSGPDGRVTCDPQPDSRAPDRQAFRLLAPGNSITSSSRLIELCPDDTFARPGLYLAHARFDAYASGSEFQFEATTGLFVSEQPAVIRIRSGELPFLGRRVMQRVKVGEP